MGTGQKRGILKHYVLIDQKHVGLPYLNLKYVHYTAFQTFILRTYDSGQPLTQFGNKCCARFSLLLILCMALSIHWVVAWLHV